jgi:hypothetical protein
MGVWKDEKEVALFPELKRRPTGRLGNKFCLIDYE